jgi:hypothetical protein
VESVYKEPVGQGWNGQGKRGRADQDGGKDFKEVIVPLLRTLIILLLFVGAAGASVKVLFLPFNDKVKLNEAWDLSVDVPRWFSVTVDTIAHNDSSVTCVPFDSILKFIKNNQWGRDDYLKPKAMQRLASAFQAQYVVCGTVKKFNVVKRAIDTDGDMVIQHNGFQNGNPGHVSSPVVGGFQSFVAKLLIGVDFYDARTGKIIDHGEFDSEQKDNGLKIFVPMQTENAELDFDHLSSTPFGSVHFCRTVVGILMKSFSLRVHEKIVSSRSKPVASQRDSLRMREGERSTADIEGKVLERDGNDVYVNLGIEDQLYTGELLEVLKPDHPVRNEKGDTLGWAEKACAQIKIRSIKSTHFSLGTIIQENDTVKAGWTVRLLETPRK